MNPNDPILYYNQQGDTCPGIILKCPKNKKRIAIYVNAPEGDKRIWVKPGSVEVQNGHSNKD